MIGRKTGSREAIATMRCNWILATPSPEAERGLVDALSIPSLVARCLCTRGLIDPAVAQSFLEPRLRELTDPETLPQMTAAVERLSLARERGERVVVFGDYDVDGVTSAGLLLEVLGRLGWDTGVYLPQRLEEGYGLSQEAARTCLERFPTTLLLAVDCGSTAVETVAWLGARGVEVVVLDHHQVSAPRPAAVALVNPQLLGPAPHPARDLCSVGLAFKLAHALVKEGRRRGWPEAASFDLRPLLDLVALGTVADLVPLTGENRILVSAGLTRLESSTRPGLVALREVARSGSPLGTYEVGFQLAPRLNAAGRLDTATTALDLLRATSVEVARPLAEALDTCNRERQRIEKAIAVDAIAAIRARFNPETDYVIVEGQLLWHLGVVGIVASRVVREFHRPAIILGGDAQVWRGSGRSIEGFDLAAALREAADLLERHGGHAMAAGLSLAPDRVDALRERLNATARRVLRPDQLRPTLRLDASVELGELTVEMKGALERLGPTGQGNPPVQLAAHRLRLRGRPRRMGAEQQHLRLEVTDGAATREVVWWNSTGREEPAGVFDLAFAPALNVFRGETRVQLRLLDWRPSAGEPV